MVLFSRKKYIMKKLVTKKFYKTHNLSRRHFAKMVGVAPDTVAKCEKGESITPETKKKVETGVKVLDELGFVYPDLRYVNTTEIKKEYAKNKKQSDGFDKKFATAYKKAMK